MTAQELLFEAHQHGVSIRTDGKGGLQAGPARLLTPERIADIKEHKRELLPLLADLERYGVAQDPLVLETMALFHASLKGFVPTPKMATERTTLTASEPEGATQALLQLNGLERQYHKNE
jgi:hypothetical protein